MRLKGSGNGPRKEWKETRRTIGDYGTEGEGTY